MLDLDDRSLRGFGAIVDKAAEKRDAQDLQGLPARHADDESGHDQRRPTGLPKGVTPNGLAEAMIKRAKSKVLRRRRREPRHE
jgi:hypothetical protein